MPTDNSTLTYNVDILLHWISIATWVLFTVYTIVFIFQSVRSHGIKLTILRVFSFRVLAPLVITIAVALLSAAIVFIQPTRVGVVVSVLSPGGVRPTALEGGFHLVIPILEQVEQYPIYWQTYTMSGIVGEGALVRPDSIRARTSDGQEVLMDSSAIFRIQPSQAVQLHIDWQHRYIEDFVRPVIQGYVRTQVSQFTVQEVNSSARRDLEIALDRLLKEEFNEKGIELDQFVLRDVTFSAEYGKSIEQKQVAFEGQTQKEYEAVQLRTIARGEADALEIRAQAQARALELIGDALLSNPDLVTYHYVDKLAPNVRAMLVPSETPLILPIEPLLEQDLSPLTTTLPITTTETTTTTNTTGAETAPQ